MKSRVLAAAAIAFAVAAVPTADAATKRRPAKLSIKQVGKPPASIQQGATFKLAIRVANAKSRRAAGGRVTVTLRTASGSKRSVAGAKLKSTKGGATRTLTFTISVAKTVPAGTYSLVACVRRTGQAKATCKTAGKVKIVAPPVTPAPQPQPAPTPAPVTPENLKAAITATALSGHLQELQESARIGGGNRASGMEGFGATSRQLVNTLRAAGYNPTVQNFSFPFFQELSPPSMARTSAPARTYVVD